VATGDITLVIPDSLPEEQTRIESFSLKDRVLSIVRGGSRRPQNETAKYRRETYGSLEPFCGCPP
jgi:hypothetical protein